MTNADDLRETTEHDWAALFKAHTHARMACTDHDGYCCPEGGCHDLAEHQYDHYASLVASATAALVAERDALRAKVERVEAALAFVERESACHKEPTIGPLVVVAELVRAALDGDA